MVFLWYFYGISWDFYGISMVFLWYFYGISWDFYGISMVFRWDFYGISMVFLWYFYGISLLWNYVIPLLWYFMGYHGISMGHSPMALWAIFPPHGPKRTLLATAVRGWHVTLRRRTLLRFPRRFSRFLGFTPLYKW